MIDFLIFWAPTVLTDFKYGFRYVSKTQIFLVFVFFLLLLYLQIDTWNENQRNIISLGYLDNNYIISTSGNHAVISENQTQVNIWDSKYIVLY